MINGTGYVEITICIKMVFNVLQSINQKDLLRAFNKIKSYFTLTAHQSQLYENTL